MIAGGSGVTPCYDVAREVLHDPTDNTRMSLVYANKHEEDIWLRKVGAGGGGGRQRSGGVEGVMGVGGGDAALCMVTSGHCRAEEEVRLHAGKALTGCWDKGHLELCSTMTRLLI
jgi:hypothetical protein